MNQDLNKAADNAKAAFSRWKAQMQREGHTKRESLDPTEVDPTTFSSAALALWNEYQAQSSLLTDQAIVTLGYEGGVKVTQPELGGKASKKGDKGNVIDMRSQFTKLADGTTTIDLAVGRYKDFVKANAHETLVSDKPKAEHLLEHDGKMYVVYQEINAEGLDPCVIAAEAIERSSWTGITFAKADQMADGIAAGGLQFVYKRKKYVVGGKDTRVIFKTKDPLTDVTAASPAADDEPLINHGGAHEITDSPDKGSEPVEDRQQEAVGV